MGKIIRNAAHCLSCNKIIESEYSHDFVRCECGNVFVDGGKSYIRRGVKITLCILIYQNLKENK